MTSERDQARAELEDLQNQTQDQGELEALRAENQRLQTEVSQFQQIKQMLGGMAGTASASQSPPQPKTTIAPASSQKRIRDEDQALGKIGEASDPIIAWNDDPAREFNHKWFISVPSILELIRGSGYSASQGRVQAAIAHRRQVIDNHHQKHGMGQRHNSRHDKPITEDLVL
ncbi:hypothetical protein IQ268_28925 [Oculatella sp. LEGE 06141]|uniref:hypothetical protein n=1 Tax=Oculatella sp. LEGE 06141 TaxID=1828648 RepID=UPI00187F81BB|nr:hypothetical protein [Oculatella sp. LEGE 06141]MBE9182578.1 hypothetical protein [Oculatella sp. LEGE 06141]